MNKVLGKTKRRSGPADAYASATDVAILSTMITPPTTEQRVHARPHWSVFVGGPALAATAGLVNITVLLSSYHVPVTHMTGAVTVLGKDIAAGATGDLRQILALIGGFLIGAIISGVVIGNATFRPGRRYGVALMIEGALFAIAAWRLADNDLAGITFAAMGCGLQNGMATSYLGLVLRTTHVTGIVTDLGVLLGHWLRHRHVQWWKLGLLTLLVCGFFLGVLGGGLLHAHWHQGMTGMWTAAIGTFVAGLGYLLWCQRQLRAITDCIT